MNQEEHYPDEELECACDEAESKLPEHGPDSMCPIDFCPLCLQESEKNNF